MLVPSKILKAFNCDPDSAITALGGTSNTTFRVNNLVFKRDGNGQKEVEWICNSYLLLQSKKIRIPKPIITNCDNYAIDRWYAYPYLEGTSKKLCWEEKFQILKTFSSLTLQLDWPDFMNQRTDPWSLAHRIVWKHIPLPNYWQSIAKKKISELQKACQCIEHNHLNFQVIHSDLAGNFIFSQDENTHGIIDFSPAFGPVKYSEAILLVDVFAWENAKINEFHFLSIDNDLIEMIKRATIFRMSVVAEFDSRNKTNRFEKETERWETALKSISPNQYSDKQPNREKYF